MHTPKVKDQKAYQRLQRARTSLLLGQPFFANLAMRLDLREDYNCQTAWTDGSVFGYNPHYINILPSKKLEGLAAHIVMHPACSHHKRRKGRDPELWNKACDYVINSILVDAGFILPDGHLLDEKKGDQSAESVYEILIAESEDKSSDDGESETDGDSEDSESTEEESEQDEDGAGGEEEPEEDDSASAQGDPGMSGEVRDEQEGAGESEEAGEPVDWEEAVIQASIHARGMGDLPGRLKRLLEDRLYPRLCWRRLLARFINSAARSDYSWTVPNPRYLHHNIYFPSLKNMEFDEIAIAIDTSGSISQEELDQFLAEFTEIVSMSSAKIHLLGCDMQIKTIRLYERGEVPEPVTLLGGGGTDFRPVFKYLEQQRINPVCLVYLTDLECLGYPKKIPAYPVLWAKVGDSSRQPPFGEVLQLG